MDDTERATGETGGTAGETAGTHENRSGDGDDTDGSRGPGTTRTLVVVIVLGFALVAGGTALAAWTTTSGGDVDVYETTIETDSGLELSATVYEPAAASAEEPAPGVTLIHGYTGTQGTMSSFATELADRGYVAVTVDQPGHGHSDPPAFADAFGGPAGLEHTRSLESVDEDRVALVGHSMGGFASLAAAEEHPEGYESIVLVGSTWGGVDAFADLPDADEEFPRNMAVIFAPYDEYGAEMWGEPVPANVHQSEKLAAAFDAEGPIEHGEVYGDVDDGTARTFTAPPTIHTGMHRSTTTVADTVEWLELTIGEPEPTELASADEQSWYWASIGHVLALVGGFVVAVGTTGLAWQRLEGPAGETAMTAESASGSTPVAPPSSETAPSSTTNGLPTSTLVALSALPALTIVPLYAIGTAAVPVTRLTHQELTHGYLVWALATVGLAAALVRLRHGGVDRNSLERLAPNRSVAIRSLAAGLAGTGVFLVVVALVDAVPGGAFNAWVVGVEPLSRLRWFSFAVYVLPFTVAAVGFAAGLERALGSSTSSGSSARALGRRLVVTCGGMAVFLAIQYVPLFLGFGIPVPELGPLAIIAINATGLLIAATLVAVPVTRLTDSPLPAGVLTGLLVTWMLVGTGPIPVAF